VPGAAAGLADIGAGHLDPPEFRRRVEHLPQQLAVGGLHASPLGEGQTGVGDPLRELIAQPLQLTEVEHPRLRGESRDPMLDVDASKCLSEKGGQPALKPADLPAQLSPREALIDLDAKHTEAVSFEQIWHLNSLAV
jgi:hypothetical protein